MSGGGSDLYKGEVARRSEWGRRGSCRWGLDTWSWRPSLGFILSAAKMHHRAGNRGVTVWFMLSKPQSTTNITTVISPLPQLPAARPKALAPPTLPSPKSFLEMLKLNYKMPAVIHLVTTMRSIYPPHPPSCGWTFDGFTFGWLCLVQLVLAHLSWPGATLQVE